jgi:hypothetical protein
VTVWEARGERLDADYYRGLAVVSSSSEEMPEKEYKE